MPALDIDKKALGLEEVARKSYLDEIRTKLFQCAHNNNAKKFNALLQDVSKSRYTEYLLSGLNSTGQNILLVTMKDVGMFRAVCEALRGRFEGRFFLLLKDATNSTQENLMHQFVKFGRVKTLKFLLEFIPTLKKIYFKEQALDALNCALYAKNKFDETPLFILTEQSESLADCAKSDQNWSTKVKPKLDKNLEEMRGMPFFIPALFNDLDEKIDNLPSATDNFKKHLKRLSALARDLNARIKSPEVEPFFSTLYTESKNLIQNPTPEQIEVHNTSCEAAMKRAEEKLRQHPGVWLNVHPIIRGILGVLAALAVLPMLVVAAVGVAKDKNYVRTFFNTPQVAQERVDAAEQIVGMRSSFSAPG